MDLGLYFVYEVVFWGCVGMYMFSKSIGVMGLLVISMACRYGDIGLGVGFC